MGDYSEKLLDKRIVERNIAKGLVDRDKYAALLEALPDSAANAEVVRLDGDQEPAAEAPVEPQGAGGAEGGTPPAPPLY